MSNLRWPLAWRHARRTTGGWTRAVGCAALLALVYALTLPGAQSSPLHLRAIELVFPFLFGLQTAILFAPDDEPMLEIVLACPRPAAYIVVERLLLLTLLQGSFALIATLIGTRVPHGESLFPALLRWLVPSLIVGSMAMYLSLTARRSAFGLLLSIVVVFFSLVGGDYILTLYPGLRFVHPFLQDISVSAADFTLNRVVLISASALILVRILWLTRDSERLLNLKGV